MFISKKDFEAAIEKAKIEAVEETRKEQWLDERLERIEREHYRVFDQLNERIRALEGIRPEDEKVCGVKPLAF